MIFLTVCKHTRVPVLIPDHHVPGHRGGKDKQGTETGRNQAKRVFNKGPTYSTSFLSLLDY